MDIFFQDPDEIRLPPEQVRLLESLVAPLPGGSRVRVYLEITPFLIRPNIEISITDSSGKLVAHTSILGAMLRKLEFIMHLREATPGNEYTLESIIYYQKLPEPSDKPMDIPLQEPLIVDRKSVEFSLPQR